MRSNHYHYGYGLTGHGPDEPERCDTIRCLASCVHGELGNIGDGWADQMHGERTHIEELKKERPSNGADPAGYPGSWESIADAALRALECLDRAEECSDLAMALRGDRENAPLYRGEPARWEATLHDLLVNAGTYPLETDIAGYHRFYVWTCDNWQCWLNEHDGTYEVPASAISGGYTPCACRDCMETVIWSPADGVAPYCHACDEAGCPDRDHGSCDVDPDGA